MPSVLCAPSNDANRRHVDPRLEQPQPPAFRRWLSQQEAAEYLGVTDRSIRNWIRSGAITGRRMRGSTLIRIDRYELEEALEVIPAAGIGR